MSRIAAVILVLAAQAPVLAQSQQVRPAQADGVVRLLTDLESALTSGRIASVAALAPGGLSADQLARVSSVLERGAIADATVRERFRRPVGAGYDVLAEVFVGYGRQGRVASWQLGVVPSPEAPDRFDLTSINELAAIDTLVKLTLDRTRQFALRDFTLQAPDLTLKMSSGAAFVAESPSGITALVLLGDGDVVFAPTDPAEQGQLRILNDQPTLSSKVESAFVRVSPLELQSRADSQALVPAKVDPRALERASAIFEMMSPRTFNLDLAGLTADRWSLEPSIGNLVVEFRTRRFGWLTYALSANEAEDVTVFDRARARNIAVYTSADRLARRGRFYSEDANAAYDVEHYALDLTFDPERLWLSGRAAVSIRVRSRVAGTVTFKLAGSLAVAAVSEPTLGPLMALRVTGQNSVIVSLPKPIERDTRLTMEFAYSGRLDAQGLEREAIAPQGFPSQQDPSQDAARLLPEVRYLYSNRSAWYPQASVTDYATARMRLRVPSEYQIVGSGSLVDVQQSKPDSTTARLAETRPFRIAEFIADRPLRYLACVISRFVPVTRGRVDVVAVAPAAALPHAPIANPFDVATPAPQRGATGGSPAVAVEIVSTPRMAGSNRQLASRLATILRLYSATIGEAPYPDFTLAAIDDTLPGGHSPAFFALLHQPMPASGVSWSSDPVAFDTTFQHFFLAHEVAHQWWGQAVGGKNYHEQWLSEGLAQYFALLYAAADRGQDMMRNLLGQMRHSALALSRNGPIYLGYRLGHIQGDGRIFRGIVYNKSALVLHMLRGLIGDEAFFAGLRKFYRDWRFQKAGTDDLRLAFEATAGRSLQAFFDRWIFSAAIPQLRTSLARAADGAPIIRVEQIGDVFEVPVTFTVQYADGTSEEVLVPVTQATVEHRLAKSVRRINVREELTLAEFR